MRAKLIINEIKQNKEESGLGSIGVGRSYVRSAYEVIKSKWPELLYRTVQDKFERIHGKKLAENIKLGLDHLSNVLGASFNEMYWIPCDYSNMSKSNREFLDFIHNEYGNKSVLNNNNMKFPKYKTYDEAHFNCHTNYKNSFGFLFYSESGGQGFDSYEQNEVEGYCIPFN